MSTLLKKFFILGILIFLLSPSLLFASDDLYDAAGIDPHRETLSSIPEEHIDPFTGGLTQSHVDIRLPGNGGLDLVIQRTFNSKNVCNGWTCVGSTCSCEKGENTWLGYGWTLHFGRLFKSYNVNIPHVVEMPDGSRHAAYTKSGSTYITKDYWLLDLGASYVLTLTNGTKIYYGQAGPSLPNWPQHSVYYATKIEDTNGNTINIYYKSSGSSEIDYVIDSVGRNINFTTSVINGATRLTSISGAGVSINYTHQSLPTLFDTLLTKANLPVGNPWEYTYDALELKSVKSPYGGVITYTYDFSEVIMGGSYLYYRTVVQKTANGRDIPAGTWTLAYSQGTNNEYTQINDPCGRTIKYSYYGYGSTYLSDGNMWKIGLPKSKEIVGEETIAYDWTNSSYISTDDYIMPTNHRDYYIYVPFLTTNSITRNGKTYTTNYSNYDGYGNPQSISESGDKTRTTSKTYWYNTSKNIVQNKPSSETVSGSFSGSFTTNYTYDSNTGNLTQLNKYGVVTNYSYFSNGNLYSTTDANGKTTYYQWSNGRISQITNPIYSILRSINSNGTIASETNGRGYTTSFTYDTDLRLTGITPPSGSNATSFTYPSDNSYKKESRGGYYIYYYLDGFGRPSGTSDSKGVTTDIGYKSCGLKDYADSNIGDTVYYDDFERVNRILHQDSNDITYTYSGSNVTVNDEANHNTSLTYNAFGNPDGKLLVAVLDASNNTTSYSYNILGSLTGVTQGSISRTFSFDSKNFLTSESHPETGTITYGRDNVGNMTSKTDALGTKKYIYDGLNRLTQVTSGAGNITFTYDNANNRTSMDNPSASVDYTYDSNNRLTQKSEIIAGRTYTTGYTYDGNDNVTDITYPTTNRDVHYYYNSNNQVTQVTQFGNSINNITYYTSGTPTGLLSRFTYGSSPTTNLTYNPRNLIQTIQAGSSVLNLTYGYDSRSNTTGITNYLDSTKNQTFSYDNLNRLTGFNGSWGTGSYVLDSTGNRIYKTVASTTTNYYYSNNRLSSTTGGEPSTFNYNGYGSPTGITWQGSSYTLSYDALNNLSSYSLGSTVLGNYSYDGDGMRVIKAVNGKTTVYHYDKEGRVISEDDGSGNFIADYIYLNGKLVAKVANDAFISPDAPSNLTATATSSSQTNLSWTDNSTNETGFKIERKAGAGGTYSQIATVGSNVITYSDTGLTPGTNYYYRVKAYDSGGDSGYSNEANATTQSGPLHHFGISTISSPQTAGTPVSITITAQDAGNYTVTLFTGTVTLSTSAGSISPTSTTAFTNGVWTGSVTVTGVGTGKTITATDPLSAKTGTSNTFNVNAGALSSITISPASATITAGSSQSYTTTGFDAYGNSVDASGTTFTISPDGSCTGASCTATVAGAHTVTGNDSGKTATASLMVNAGALSSITISPASATIIAGGSQSYTTTGFDAYGNSLGNVTSSTVFTISPNGLCTGATCTATVASAHTVTGNDSGKTATASLMVNAGALSSITISPASATITAGSSQSYTTTGFDTYGNSVDASGTTFTISPDGSCTGASCTATVAGAHTVTGNDSGKTATASLMVNAGTAVAFSVTAPAIVTGGTPFDVTVTARDAYNNTAIGYVGTVHVTSTDLNAGIVLPVDYAFQPGDNGSHTFTAGATLETTGTQTVTATDTVTSSITGTSGSIAVNPDVAAKFSVTAPAIATAGAAFDITVAAKDIYGNTVSGYAGTVHFMSSDTYAGLPSDYTFVGNDNGSHTFTVGVTLETTGTQTVTATDTVTSSITGTSGSIAVSASILDHITISPSPQTITAGASQNYTAQGFDAYGNSLGNVTSSTTFTISPDGSCTGASCTATVAGAHTVTGNDSGKTATASLMVIQPPAITATPNPVAFGSVAVGSSSIIAIQVKNTGGGTLQLGSIGSPSAPFSIYSDGCSAMALVPSSSCSVQVKFAPTTVGAKSATLTIPSNDPVTPTVSVSLTGTGVTPTYSISGTVTNAAHAPLAGVTITLSGAGTGTTTADTNGNYTFTSLDNGTYTITPSMIGYTFTPTSRGATVSDTNVTGQNFTGTVTATYSISGTVTSGGGHGTPIPGVTMTLSGAGTGTTTTDTNGNYTFTGLANGTYTVTPSKTGYTFTPASKNVTINGANVTGQNFTGTAYSISGTVTSGGSPFSGVTMTLSGTASGTTTTDSSGNYTFTGLANGTYTVTPSKTGYTFTPASRNVTISGANVIGQNFTGTAYSISGTVTSGGGHGTPIPGVTMTLSGAGTGTTTTDTNGNYTFTGLANGTYTVTPSKTGYTFTPTSKNVTINGANVTGQNFTGSQ